MSKILLTTVILLASSSSQAEVDVIYGEDNRQDIYEVRNSMHKSLAKSTAGMIPAGMFARSAREGHFELKSQKSLETGANVCSSEKFADQLLAPSCSGFLVGPDLLVTAGHCYKSFSTPENVCKTYAWVFDYDMKSRTHNPSRNIPVTNIYLCKEIVAADLTRTMDFAIIRLDRKVVGRTPLKIRTSGKVSSSTELVVIGHPSGLPTKVAGKGKITYNSLSTTFSTTLDTFHGNSGSAVFDARSGVVEGILIQGKNDYQPSIASNPKSCMVVNKCDETANNCSAGVESGPVAKGEVVLRVDKIANLIKKALEVK